MKTGKIPYRTKNGNTGGLCGCFGERALKLFQPEREELENSPTWGYWGVDGEISRYSSQQGYLNKEIIFSPLRQTIVLFLAAMNDEL